MSMFRWKNRLLRRLLEIYIYFFAFLVSFYWVGLEFAYTLLALYIEHVQWITIQCISSLEIEFLVASYLPK